MSHERTRCTTPHRGSIAPNRFEAIAILILLFASPLSPTTSRAQMSMNAPLAPRTSRARPREAQGDVDSTGWAARRRQGDHTQRPRLSKGPDRHRHAVSDNKGETRRSTLLSPLKLPSGHGKARGYRDIDMQITPATANPTGKAGQARVMPGAHYPSHEYHCARLPVCRVGSTAVDKIFYYANYGFW